MKKGQTPWSREELILAVNLYCQTPFGKLHSRNPEIIQFANLIGRTPNSVAYKLVNLASLDPTLKIRGIKGASNTSRLDKQIWAEFFENLEELSFQSEILKANFQKSKIETTPTGSDIDFPEEGKTRDQMVKARLQQSFFRNMVLASYNFTCCITGIQNPSLLIAGHIIPWGVDANNRLNPSNGISINPLHDKAFECGLLTITPEYTIKISSKLFNDKNKPQIEDLFLKYHGHPIILPTKFLPDRTFLEYHNDVRFLP
jgi:putative restriction endonuclease